MSQQQPTSLLSLPDELLVQIFDYLAQRVWKGIPPVFPLTLVCRRIRKLAQAVLYRDVFLRPYTRAIPHLPAIIGKNPSLGQLVNTLTVHGKDCPSDLNSDLDSNSDEVAIHDSEAVLAMTSAASNLKELNLSYVTTKEACSILAALPSTSLRSLDMVFLRTRASLG